jgi:hypothetical protein
MILFIKFIKKILNSLNSNAAPWQIALGAFLGMLIAFWPIWPPGGWPTPIGLALIAVALGVNCHLGSVLCFWGIGSLLQWTLAGPAIAIGNGLSGVARFNADVPLLYHSFWSHTGYLGLVILGACLAPLAGIGMYRLTVHFRTKWLPKLKERQRLIKAGKVAGNTILMRVVFWFFGIS